MSRLLELLKSWVGAAFAVIFTVISGTAVTVSLYKDIQGDIDEVNTKLVEITSQKATNQRQWQRIYDLEGRLSTVEVKTEPITQTSWEDWGRVKDAVGRHEDYIREHRRNHP